ncbi:MAG: glycosyltransferase [Anaerolineae bacterium]
MALLVSICLPTFNRADLLQQVVKCALAQTWRAFELIVVDNASTDDTPERAARWMAQDARLRYQRNVQNLGMVGNWNRALELAQGDFVTLWHDDDVYYPELLQFEVEALQRAPDAGFAYAACDLIDSTGQRLGRHRPFVGDHVWPAEKEFSHLIFNCYPAAPLLRRECLRDGLRFNPQLVYAADWEFLLRLATRWGGAYLDRSLAAYRFHTARTTATLSQNRVPLGLDQCAAFDSVFAQPVPFKSIARYRQIAYAELAQRLLIDFMRAVRRREETLACSWLKQALFVIFRRVGPRFVSYSIRDAVRFSRRRQQSNASIFETTP